MASGPQPDPAQLRALLAVFTELPPKVRTETRRELRASGDDIISEQRAVLDGPLPPGVGVTGSRLTLASYRGRSYVRSVNVFGDQAVKRGGRTSGLREGIKNALVTRVVTGSTRQSVEIKTQNSRAPMSTGWNAKRFRHPVFGDRNRSVYQQGQPYFFAPIFKGRREMIARAIDILNDAVEGR